MAKSRARFLAELLGSDGLVKTTTSSLAGADGIIDLGVLPSIPNSKLTNSSITINTSATSLGGSITLTTADVAENTNLYYTNARADARIAAADTDDLSEGSSNLYFTNARADARVALVVDSAPSTLNTLNELAAALGDDANFSTTVTNSIAAKLPLAGGTMTGNVTLEKSANPTFSVTETGAGAVTIQGTGSGGRVYSNSGNKLLLGAGGQNSHLTINTSGNVGIGTIPATHYTGYEALDIGDTLSLMSNNTSTNVSTLTNNGYLNSDASNWVRKVADESTAYEQVSGDHRFKSAASDSAGTAITWSERMRIDSSGNVGIGNISPQKKLTIGSSQGEGIQFTYDGTNNYRSQILTYWTSNTDSRMDFNIARSSGVTPATIMSVGYGENVGIGTTSPVSKLHVKTSVDNSVAQGLVIERSANTDRGYINYNGGGFQFRSTVGDPIVFGETDAEHMRIIPDGNVGIGTNSPYGKLQIEGNTNSWSTAPMIVFSSSSSSANASIRDWAIGPADTSYGYFHINQGATTGASPLATSNVRFTISDTGNVGIGDITPEYKFTVEGSASDDWISRIYNTSTSGGGLLVRTDATAANDKIAFGVYSDSAYKMVVRSDGKVGIGTTSPANQLVVKSGSNCDFEVGSESGGNFIQTYNRTTSAYGYLRFITSGETMRIDASGNVGIGTDSPVTTLDVLNGGNTYTSGLLLRNGTSTSEASSFWHDNQNATTTWIENRYDNAGSAIKFRLRASNAAAGTAMTINGDGNVGIGDITPSETLELTRLGKIGFGMNGNYGARLGYFDDGGGTHGFHIDTKHGGTTTSETTFVVRADSGNVGIGTKTPIAPLHVAGNAVIETGSPDLYFATTAATHYNWRVAAQESVDAAFEIASGTQSAGSNAVADTYTARLVVGASGGLSLPTNTWQNSDVLKKYRLVGPGSTTTVRTINVGTYWTFNARGGCFMFMMHGWQSDSATGMIHWHNNGTSSNVISAAYLNEFHTPTGLSVSVAKGSGDLDIDITLVSTHTNSHGWIFEVWV